jgi:hypothetical protein
MTFREFLRLSEGLMIDDRKAEEGKSRVKNPPVIGPKNSIKPTGVSGGPGNGMPASTQATPVQPSQ